MQKFQKQCLHKTLYHKINRSQHFYTYKRTKYYMYFLIKILQSATS